ncbi:protein kinase [Kribbella sp. NPDC026596]|uniref:protein kinase domain-containing protein n=1 Tax=Kribbella sp. NPDC026596 TaxID=3155122 RepID=UPI0033F89732
MGEVWTCRDRELRREVAVKFLAPDDAVPPDLQQRFEREAVAAAQINHPNVVALHDRGVDRDYLFLVMERVDGTTLAAHVRDSGPLPPRRSHGRQRPAVCPRPADRATTRRPGRRSRPARWAALASRDRLPLRFGLTPNLGGLDPCWGA